MKKYTLDGVDAVIYSPVCARCKRFTGTRPGERTCEAYPDGIPPEIWLGDDPHTTPHEGDGGKQFVPRPGAIGKPPERKPGRGWQSPDEEPESRFVDDMQVIQREEGSDDDVRKAERVYLEPGEKPPAGVQVKTGPRGGRYYISGGGRPGGSRAEGDRAGGDRPGGSSRQEDRLTPLKAPPPPTPPPHPEGIPWLDPVKDNPYPPDTVEAHEWIRKNEDRFAVCPYDKKEASVLRSLWLDKHPDRIRYNLDLEQWQAWRQVEKEIVEVGIPRDHTWATKERKSKGEMAPTVREWERFHNRPEEEIRKLKAEGVPVPYEFDPDYSEDEKKSIYYYTGVGYRPIKIMLRDEKSLDEKQLQEKRDLTQAEKRDVYNVIKRIEAAIDRERVPVDDDIFHGIRHLREMGGPIDPDSLRPGDVLQDSSFTSWSLDPWVSYEFTGHRWKVRDPPEGARQYPIVLRIKNPKGLPGIYVGGDEREIILKDRARYRVLAVDDVGVDPRVGWDRYWRENPAGPEIHWKVITVEQIPETHDDDTVQKGERIYVTPEHPAPPGVKLYRGPHGGVFYFGKREEARAEGMLAPKPRPGTGTEAEAEIEI